MASTATTKKTTTKKATVAPAPTVAEPVTTVDVVPVTTAEVKQETVEVVQDTPATPVNSANPVDGIVEAVTGKYQALLTRITSLSNELRDLTSQLGSLRKEHVKLIRDSLKKSAKSKPRRKATGINTPIQLSNEMYEFLGLEKGSLVVRNNVTKLLHDYIVSHNLRDSKDKRNILTDDKLQKLLNIPADVKLNYFNLQTYMRPHFIHSQPTTTTPATTTTA